MKKLFKRMTGSIKNFVVWVLKECKDWKTLILLGVVCLLLGFPVWAGYLLGFLFALEWAIITATIAWAFWMLPGAPFFALAVTITLAIKKIYEKYSKKEETIKTDEPVPD